MVVRSVATPVPQQQGSAAQLPWGWLGYVETAVAQTGIVGATDLTGLSVAVTVGTSRRIELSFSVYMGSSVANDGLAIRVLEGATQLGESQTSNSVTGQGFRVNGGCIITPSAGAHTYKLVGVRGFGSGTLQTFAAAAYPAWFLVKDIGPA